MSGDLFAAPFVDDLAGRSLLPWRPRVFVPPDCPGGCLDEKAERDYPDGARMIYRCKRCKRERGRCHA